MIDPRMQKLADLLVGYSVKVGQGDKVLIDSYEIPSDMICVLVDRVCKAGGVPFVDVHDAKIRRALISNATQEQMKTLGRRDLEFMKDMACYISLRGGNNVTELSDVPDDKMKIYQQYWQEPVMNQRVDHTKWVVLRWPSSSMAQLAGMSTESFENFYFDVCTLDYEKMSKAMIPLKDRMERTDRVRIIGPKDTNLEFSIKGIPAVLCDGQVNIPDGELFTAPVKDSSNGVIHFNAGTLYHGKPFDDIRLVLKDGKVVEATGSDTKALNDILDCDDGARYIGEFSLGFNPHIKHAMRDILFDEKIDGSIHFTPGRAYQEADNGNKSEIHWDMVMIQRPEYGGGEIYFDDELIRKDGRFVPDYLQGLNPENLV